MAFGAANRAKRFTTVRERGSERHCERARVRAPLRESAGQSATARARARAPLQESAGQSANVNMVWEIYIEVWKSKEFLKGKCVGTLILYNTNPTILLTLWSELKRRAHKRGPSTLDDLERFYKEEWSQIPFSAFYKLIGYFVTRLFYWQREVVQSIKCRVVWLFQCDI